MCGRHPDSSKVCDATSLPGMHDSHSPTMGREHASKIPSINFLYGKSISYMVTRCHRYRFGMRVAAPKLAMETRVSRGREVRNPSTNIDEVRAQRSQEGG